MSVLIFSTPKPSRIRWPAWNKGLRVALSMVFLIDLGPFYHQHVGPGDCVQWWLLLDKRDEGITVSAGCRPFGTPIRCPMSGLGRAELEEFHLVLCPKNSSVPGWYTVVWLWLCVLGYWKGFQHFYTEHSVSFFSTKISSKFFFLQFLTHWRIPLQKAWLITFMVRWLHSYKAVLLIFRRLLWRDIHCLSYDYIPPFLPSLPNGKLGIPSIVWRSG